MTVLFPQLMREFNVDTATVQWITTIYLLVVAATMPLSSYLNRRFKHRTLFLAAVALARAWLAHYDRRSCVPGHSHCPCDSGHGFRCGHAVDDQHHS